MIEVRGLSKLYKVSTRRESGVIHSLKSLFRRDYRYVLALDKIDWKVEQGEIHALIGRNGSGKSTLVKILSGILFPTEGTVTINNKIPWENRKQYVKQIGVVFGHKSQLSWELPAIDTYELHRSLFEVEKNSFLNNLRYLVKEFDADEIVAKPVRNLSLGERMKCEIICCLLHNPKVLFLDEPTIGLDLISKDQVRGAIRKVNQELGTTILLTSHDISDVSSLCSRINLIEKGKFLFEGKIDDLLELHAGYKTVSVDLNKKVDDCYFNGISIVKTGEYSFRMEMQGDAKSMQQRLSQLLIELPVSDLNIESMKLEQVVKTYYEGSSRFKV